MSPVLRLCVIAILGLFMDASFAKEPFKPNLGPDLPTITVICGDVTLVLRQASQWTPSRIDYRGSPMTTERSAYGTVFSFNEVGFIGTGHLENEPEPLKSLTFILDGQPVAVPTAEMKGQTFRFERTSRIRNFDLTCIIEIRDNRLYETTTVHTDEEQPLNLVYHFMHAWVPTVTAYLAGQDAAPDGSISGELLDTPETLRQFYINKRVDWISVYDAKSSQYAVSRLTQVPAKGSHISMIWNVPPTYRKYYLKCFSKDTVPANFTGTWKMTTAFGAVSVAEWSTSARETAAALKP
ncbi:hypothetical protein WJU23_12160 [Prosthecobacter sp. SYSU 5D2]|uniref:hypothetical protein n=1 Tax=Prosthecobacter sp. SYSU 5D2 TaxID=3134134 RepID=UPI0031FEDDB3